jgi:archaellum component FlaC
VKSIFEIQLKDGASKSLDKIIGKVKEVTKQLNTFEKALGGTISKTTDKIVEQQKELEKLWILTQKMASQKTKKQGGSKDSSASESVITDSKKKFEKFTSDVIRKISELKEKIKGIFESVRSYSAETIGKVKDKLKQGIETGIDKLKGLKEKAEGIVESIKKMVVKFHKK